MGTELSMAEFEAGVARYLSLPDRVKAEDTTIALAGTPEARLYLGSVRARIRARHYSLDDALVMVFIVGIQAGRAWNHE